MPDAKKLLDARLDQNTRLKFWKRPDFSQTVNRFRSSRGAAPVAPSSNLTYGKNLYYNPNLDIITPNRTDTPVYVSQGGYNTTGEGTPFVYNGTRSINMNGRVVNIYDNDPQVKTDTVKTADNLYLQKAGTQAWIDNNPAGTPLYTSKDNPLIYSVFGDRPATYSPMVTRTAEMNAVPITDQYGRQTVVPINETGALKTVTQGSYALDKATSLREILSSIGTRSGLGSLFKGITSGVNTVLATAHYALDNSIFAKKDEITPAERAILIQKETEKRLKGSTQAESGFPGSVSAFMKQIGRKNELIPVVPGTTMKIGDTSFKGALEAGKVEWLTDEEYDGRKWTVSFQNTRDYFAEFWQNKLTPETVITARSMGWKPTPEQQAEIDRMNKIPASARPSFNSEEALAQQFLADRAERTSQEAFNKLQAGDVIGAHQTRVDAIKMERTAGGESGYADPYFAYTWIESPENEEKFIQTVASMEMQLGRKLTNFEIWKARDNFVDPWQELTGDMIFDWTNVLGGMIEEPARKIVQSITRNVTKAAQESNIPIIRSIGNRATRSAAGSLSHGANEIFMGIAHTVGAGDTAGEDFIRRVAEVGDAVANGLPADQNLIKVLNLPPEFAGRQERILLALSNLAGANKKLVDTVIDPGMWGDLAQNAYKRLFNQVLEQEQTKLLARGVAADIAAEEAGKLARKVANDPRKIVPMMASEFRSAYLAAMGAPESAFMRVYNNIMGGWATAVLSLRPAWLFRNWTDNMIRLMVFGGNPLNGLDQVVGRLGDMPGLVERLQRMGIFPVEFSETFMRSTLEKEGETVLERSMRGWKPRGFWDFFVEANREARKRNEFGAKWADMLLGTTTEDDITISAGKKAWLATTAGLRNAIGTVSGGISDWNNAIEMAFKVRMFDQQLTENLRVINKAGRSLVMRTLRQMDATDRVRKMVGQLWDTYYTDPEAIRLMMRDLLVGQNDLLRVVSVLTPDNLDQLLGALSPERRMDFIRDITEKMRVAIETARLNGQPFDGNKFFVDLASDFDGYKTAMLNANDMRVPNDPTLGAAGVHVDPADVQATVPGDAPATAFHETRRPKIEAAVSVKRSRDVKSLMSSVRDAITRYTIEPMDAGGDLYKVDIVDGKVRITLSPDIQKKTRVEAAGILRDTLASAVNKETGISFEQVKRFLTSPLDVRQSDRATFDRLVKFFDDDPDLRRVLAGLNRKDTLDYGRFVERTDLPDNLSKDIRVTMDEGATDAEIKRLRSGRVYETGREAAMSNRNLHDEITQLTGDQKNFLMSYAELNDLVHDRLRAFGLRVWPGPLRTSGPLRSQLFEVWDDMLSSIYEAESRRHGVYIDIARTGTADQLTENQFPSLAKILEGHGFSFEFRKDGSLSSVIYKPYNPNLGGPNRKLATRYRKQMNEFIKIFLGNNTTNSPNMRKMITEMPYTRELWKGEIRMPTTRPVADDLLQDAVVQAAPEAAPKTIKRLPTRIKKEIQDKVGFQVTDDAKAKVVMGVKRATRADYEREVIAQVGEKKAKDVMTIADTLANHYAKVNNLTIDDWYDHMLLQRGGPDVGGLYDERWYYSQLQKTVEGMPNKMSAEQFRGWIKGKVKLTEWDAMDMEDFLETHPTVTKDDLLDYLRQNEMTVEDVWYGVDKPVYTQPSDFEPWRTLPNGDTVLVTKTGIEEGRVHQIRGGEFEATTRKGADARLFANLDDAQEWLEQEFIGVPIVRDVQYREAVSPGGKEYREVVIRSSRRDPKLSAAQDEWDAQYNQITELSNQIKAITANDPEYRRIDGQIKLLEDIKYEDPDQWRDNTARIRELEQARMDREEQIAGHLYKQKAEVEQRFAKLGSRPEPAIYESGHWEDVQNPVLHIRFKDDTLPDGRRVLRIEEWQSDWSTEIREKGSRENVGNAIDRLRRNRRESGILRDRRARIANEIFHSRDEEINAIIVKMSEIGDPSDPLYADLSRSMDRIHDQIRVEITNNTDIQDIDRQLIQLQEEAWAMPVSPNTPPSNPLLDNWEELAIKRMIRYAAENGYDTVAWTPGKIHADRWGSESLVWVRNPDGSFDLTGRQQAGGQAAGMDLQALAFEHKMNALVNETIRSRDDLIKPLKRLVNSMVWHGDLYEEHINKLADRLWKRMQDSVDGGRMMPRAEGLEQFYDVKMPNVAGKYIKKFGAKMEEFPIGAADPETIVQELPFDEVRQIVLGNPEAHVQYRYRTGGAGIWTPVPQDRIISGNLYRIEDADFRVITKEPSKELNFHGFAVTPQMKEVAMQGQPLFDMRNNVKMGSTRWIENSQAIINIFDGGDPVTIVHETVHAWLPMMGNDDLDVVTRWLKDNHNIDLPAGWQLGHTEHREAKEMFANAFFDYIKTNKAPNKELRGVFQRFKRWLTDIYKTITGQKMDVKLNDEVKDLFDRWLAETPEIDDLPSAARPPQAVPSTEGILPENQVKMAVDFTPEEKALVDAELAKQTRRANLRLSLRKPARKIKDRKAGLLVRQEAQEMMLDLFNIDSFEGRTLTAAEWKKELERLPWGKQAARWIDDTNPRQSLINALEQIVSGEDTESELITHLRTIVQHNLEDGVGIEEAGGITLRPAHPYIRQMLEYDDVDAVNKQWIDALGRDPMQEIGRAAEARANKDAFWQAFTQQKYMGSKSIKEAWGQFSRSPEVFIAHLRDLMANLPEGTSDAAIESLQMLMFQVQNFYAITHNFSDALGLIRSNRLGNNVVIPLPRSATRLPSNFTSYFGEVADAAATIDAYEQGMKAWKDHVVAAADTPTMQLTEDEIRLLDQIADDTARSKQTAVNLAAYGQEADIQTQVRETLGILVNKKLQQKKVNGKWMPLSDQEKSAIERLVRNMEEQAALVNEVGNVPEGALPKTNRYMIDYNNYSTLDEKIKKVIPFWTFASRSAPFWAETLATHPEILTIYNKYIMLSRRVQYQQGIHTSNGEQMPSLEGYFKVPGTDIWFNPTMSMSFRYIIPDYKYEYEEYDDMPTMARVMTWIQNQANATGVSISPIYTIGATALGWNANAPYPVSSLTPQASLMPPWWIDSVRNWYARHTGNTYATDVFLGSEVPWMDYMIERRLLANALQEMQAATTEAERVAIQSRVKGAIFQREASDYWNQTKREMQSSQLNRSWFGYMTGLYGKDFTDAEIEFQQLRDEVNQLRDQINNEVGVVLFNLDDDPEARYEAYRDRLYKTPDGYLANVYNMLRYVRTEDGKSAQGDERRDMIAKKIHQEEITADYYEMSSMYFREMQEALRQLPVGEEFAMRDQIYKDYAAKMDELESNPMYADARRDWQTGYKPESMIYDHFESMWWKIVGATKPTWDREGGESYDEWKERVAQWELDLPKHAASLATTMGAALAKELGMEQETFQRTALYAGVDLAGSRNLDVQKLFANLMKNTDADRYNYWKKTRDNSIEALDAAWEELYWDKYWEHLSGKDGYERSIAEQEFLLQRPKPTTEELIAWVMENYPKGQFTVDELRRWADGRGVKSITERMAPKDETEAMGNRIWDIINAAGPNKKALRAEFIKLGGKDYAIDMWFESGGNPDAWGDREDFQAVYAKLVQAANNLGLPHEPTIAQMTEWKEAQQLNEQLTNYYKQELGDDYMELMVAYWNASSAERRAMRAADPRIDKYYDIRDVYAEQYPLWDQYYGSGAASSTSSSGTFTTSNGRVYRSGSTRTRTSTTTVSGPPQYTLGLGERSTLVAGEVPFRLGKGGASPGIKITPEMRKVIGDVATRIIETGDVDETTKRYVDELVKRHPDLDKQWKEINKKLSTGPGGGAPTYKMM